MSAIVGSGGAGGANASQWPWMKRYRVWQANREVFLWPENWLYPELRDDQSPLFQQAMSDLLQSDITDDAAASAYLEYLTGLEAVAKLEPCGLYYVPAAGNADEISYVVARTAGASPATCRKRLVRQKGPLGRHAGEGIQLAVNRLVPEG